MSEFLRPHKVSGRFQFVLRKPSLANVLIISGAILEKGARKSSFSTGLIRGVAHGESACGNSVKPNAFLLFLKDADLWKLSFQHPSF